MEPNHTPFPDIPSLPPHSCDTPQKRKNKNKKKNLAFVIYIFSGAWTNSQCLSLKIQVSLSPPKPLSEASNYGHLQFCNPITLFKASCLGCYFWGCWVGRLGVVAAFYVPLSLPAMCLQSSLYRKRSFLSLCSQQATIIVLYTGFGDSINHKHCHNLHSGHRLRQSPVTPTWSQASAQTVDIHMVCNNHMDQEHNIDSVFCRTSDVVRALGCNTDLGTPT